jgi:hypothetical protein
LSKYKSCSSKSKYCKANVFFPNYFCIIAEEQDILLETSLRKIAADNSDIPPATRKPRTCRKCKCPMKGHPKTHCPSDIIT